jgi:hypothetical protein
MEIDIGGVDLAKRIFQLHGCDQRRPGHNALLLVHTVAGPGHHLLQAQLRHQGRHGVKVGVQAQFFFAAANADGTRITRRRAPLPMSIIRLAAKLFWESGSSAALTSAANGWFIDT